MLLLGERQSVHGAMERRQSLRGYGLSMEETRLGWVLLGKCMEGSGSVWRSPWQHVNAISTSHIDPINPAGEPPFVVPHASSWPFQPQTLLQLSSSHSLRLASLVGHYMVVS